MAIGSERLRCGRHALPVRRRMAATLRQKPRSQSWKRENVERCALRVVGSERVTRKRLQERDIDEMLRLPNWPCKVGRLARKNITHLIDDVAKV